MLGKVNRVVVWRLDRLGRTARGLTVLFEDLLGRRGGPGEPEGGAPTWRRRRAGCWRHVLASVAMFETEVAGSERIVAGQAAAREAGKRWGGSPKGRRLKVTEEQESAIRRMTEEGEGVTAVVRATGLSRPTGLPCAGHEGGFGCAASQLSQAETPQVRGRGEGEAEQGGAGDERRMKSRCGKDGPKGPVLQLSNL